jgi:hypothetical protein
MQPATHPEYSPYGSRDSILLLPLYRSKGTAWLIVTNSQDAQAVVLLIDLHKRDELPKYFKKALGRLQRLFLYEIMRLE